MEGDDVVPELEPAPDPVLDTPAEPATTDPQMVPWDRYTEVQGWATKAAQEAAENREYRRLVENLQSDDTALVKEAAQALNIAYDEPDPAPTQAGMDPQLLQRLDAHEQFITEQRQQAQYAQYRDTYDPQIESLGVPIGLRQWVADRALELPAVQGPNGPEPNLKAAFAEIEALAEPFSELKATQAALAKRRKQQPAPPAGPATRVGSEGTVIPASTHEARTERMLARLADT